MFRGDVETGRNPLRAGYSSLIASLAGLLAAAGLAHHCGVAAEPPARPARLTVALLPFEDQTGDAEAAHWRHGLSGLLRNQLREVKSIRILSADAIDYGCRQVSVTPGGPIPDTQARRIGEVIEARRVVWGSYRRDGTNWVVSGRVLQVASGQTSKELRAVSADWFEVRDQLNAQVLAELGVEPTPPERVAMARRPTGSSAAWGWFSQALAAERERLPESEAEARVRRALQADPQFAEAHVGLAACLGTEGQFEQAQESAREALRLKPDLASGHLTLGICLLLVEKSQGEAERELREARRLDPDDAEALVRLGELYAMRDDDLVRATSFWRDGRRLEPTSGAIRAHLGVAYARLGDRAAALAELQEAERLDPADPNAEQMISRGYDALHDTPAAVAHYARFIALARRLVANPELIRTFEKRIEELRATLTPHAVTASLPKCYTPETLAAALRQHLAPDEWRNVVNPLAGSPEMKRWGEELTRGATNEFGRAQRLFEALQGRLDPGAGGSRTAQEVFAAWNDPGVSFRCQEYARLYVALAREAGLRAFYVMVAKTIDGRMIPHACAAVFVDNQAWLVDPSFQWFGVPHLSFEVLDDYQAVANHLHQQDDLRLVRLAVKLQPDSALAQFNLAFHCLRAGLNEEGDRALAEGLRIAPGTYLAEYGLGLQAAAAGRWAAAAEHLGMAVRLNPDFDRTYYVFAQVLREQGTLKEAREQYRAFLDHESQPGLGDQARRAVAEINEKLGNE
jgi:tetratricopeptide (TPR) repeat protein/TolB-like protein